MFKWSMFIHVPSLCEFFRRGCWTMKVFNRSQPGSEVLQGPGESNNKGLMKRLRIVVYKMCPDIPKLSQREKIAQATSSNSPKCHPFCRLATQSCFQQTGVSSVGPGIHPQNLGWKHKSSQGAAGWCGGAFWHATRPAVWDLAVTESRKKGWSSEDQGKDPPVNIQKAMDRSEIICFHGELSIAMFVYWTRNDPQNWFIVYIQLFNCCLDKAEQTNEENGPLLHQCCCLQSHILLR